MKITLQIRDDLTQIEQMTAQMSLAQQGDFAEIPPFMGKGSVRYTALPFGIQLHHYQYCLNHEIWVEGQNTREDGMYILNINLSGRLLDKNVGEGRHWLSQGGQYGALLYAPGNNSFGKSEIGASYEVVFFSIPQATMVQFLASSNIEGISLNEAFCRYVEFQDELIERLIQALGSPSKQNLFVQQGEILAILGDMLQQFSGETWIGQHAKLNMEDIQRLLHVKTILNQHIFGNAPTIDQLAKACHISASKLKTDFKTLFGSSIYQYYLRNKLQVARQLLKNREGSIAEIGYKLGYNNISQFSAQFKKYHGISPREV